MPFHQKRVPAGTSAGGQFSPTLRADDIEINDKQKLLGCQTFIKEDCNAISHGVDAYVDGPWNEWDSPASCKTFLFVGVSEATEEALKKSGGMRAKVRHVGVYDLDSNGEACYTRDGGQANKKEATFLPPLFEIIDEDRMWSARMSVCKGDGNHPREFFPSSLRSQYADDFISDFQTSLQTFLPPSFGDESAITLCHNINASSWNTDLALTCLPVDYIISNMPPEETEKIVNQVSATETDFRVSSKTMPQLREDRVANAKIISNEQLENMVRQSNKNLCDTASVWQKRRLWALERKYLNNVCWFADLSTAYAERHWEHASQDHRKYQPLVGEASKNPIEGLKWKVEGPFLCEPVNKVKSQIEDYGGEVVQYRGVADLVIKGSGGKTNLDLAIRHDSTMLSENDYLDMLACAQQHGSR